jgi:hypothetical protein
MPRTGRSPGGRGPGAKVPDADVPRIRKADAAGRTTSKLATELNVADSTVLLCVKGQTYRDLRGPISKGKGDHAARGDRNGRARLDETRVLEIRAAWASGETVRSLAARHGVCHRTICKIVNGITWKHVKRAPWDDARASVRRQELTIARRRAADAPSEIGAGRGAPRPTDSRHNEN